MGSPSPLFSFGGWYGSPFGRRRNHCSSRPCEGGDGGVPGIGQRLEDFNSRPREGGDTESPEACQRHRISIHAPAKGATETPLAERQTPAYFNSRPREGGDIQRLPEISATRISIHAPANGGAS